MASGDVVYEITAKVSEESSSGVDHVTGFEAQTRTSFPTSPDWVRQHRVTVSVDSTAGIPTTAPRETAFDANKQYRITVTEV